MKGFADFTYRTGRVRKKFGRDNPNEIVLAADASKGVITKEDQCIRHGANWVTSQRAVILLTDRRIICGKWVIPLVEISDAQLIKYGSGHVLKIQTNNGKHYQFGMQANPEWTNQQILPLTLEKGQVKYSFFSIIVRLITLGCIIYLIYSRFISR